MINQTGDSAQAPFTTETIPTHFLRRAWMEKIGVTNVMLAKRFDLTPARVSSIIRGGECPKKYIDILRDEYEMPIDLLPERSREKTGPRPKTR